MLWFNPLPERSIEIPTPLPIAEVMRRLQEGVVGRRAPRFKLLPLGVDYEPYWVLGEVKGNQVWLSARSRQRAHSWRPTLHGELVADGDGSVVSGMVLFPRWAQVFGAVWVSVVFLALLVAIAGLGINLFSGGGQTGSVVFMTAIMAALFGFGLMLTTVLGPGWGRDDEAYLLEWVKGTLTP
ncbi:MAG: hypothetical protein ACJ72L_21700 [Marmoricola sp.]